MFFKIVARCVGLVAASAMIGLVGGLVWLSATGGSTFVREQILDAAAPFFPNGSLQIGSLDMNLLSHIVLMDIQIQDEGGKPLVSVSRVGVYYSLEELVLGRLRIDSIEVDGPAVDLTVDNNGVVDLSAVFGPSEEASKEPTEPAVPFSGLPLDISLGRFSITKGQVKIIDPAGDTVIPAFGMSLSAQVVGATVRVSDVDIEVDLDAPIDQLFRLDGGLILEKGDLQLELDAVRLGDLIMAVAGEIKSVETSPVLGLKLTIDPIDPATIEALAGEPMLSEPGYLSMAIDGPLSDLAVDAVLMGESKRGELGLSLRLDLEASPLGWAVALEPRQFDVHALTPLVPGPFILNGRYGIKGTGTDYPQGLSATISMEANGQVFAGEVVHSLVINGSLAGGQLHLETVSVEHEAANILLTGGFDLVASTADISIKAEIPDASKLQKYGAEGLRGAVVYDGQVRAGWAPEVRVDLDGNLVLSAFRAPGVSIGRGGGPLHAKLRGEAAVGTGTISLEGVDASGTKIDHIQVDFSGEKSADGDVNIEANLEIGVIVMPDGAFEMEGLEGKLVAAIPVGRELSAEAKLDVQTFRFGHQGYEVDGGPVTFAVSGNSVEADIDLRREDAPFLAGNIRGDLETGEWFVDGFQFAVLKGDGMASPQKIQFRLADGGAEDVHFELANADGKGRLSVEGSASATAPDLRISADKIDLGYVMEMVQQIVDLSPVEAPAADVDLSAPPVQKKPSKDQIPVKGGDVAAVEPENTLGGLMGEASMDIRVKGDGDKMQASGWMSIDGLVIPGQVDGLNTRIEVDVTDTEAIVLVQVGDEKRTIFWLRGAVPVVQKAGLVTLDCDGKIQLRSYIPGARLQTLAEHIPAIGDLDGRASMDLSMSGEACNPDIKMVAAVDTPVGPQGERLRLDVEFERLGDTIEATTIVGQDNHRIAQMSVVLATTLTQALQAMLRDGRNVDLANPNVWLENFDVKLALLGVDVGHLSRMAEISHPIRGVLAGGIDISGTMASPKLEGGFILVDGQIGAAKLKQFTTRFSEQDDGYGLETVVAFEDEGRFAVDGFIPISLGFEEEMDLDRPGLDIRLSGSGFPLAMGAGPSGLTKAKGTIGIKGGVTGTLGNPQLHLKVLSQNAGFTLLPTAIRYEPIEIDVEYLPGFVDISTLKIRTTEVWGAKPGSGFFSLAGTVAMGVDGPENMDVEVEMDEFWVSSTAAASVATSGKISIEGNYPALKVKGHVKVDQANIAVGAEVLKTTSSFDIDEGIKVHRDKRIVVERVEIEDDDGPSVADNISLDLEVNLNSKVRIKADIPMSEDFGAQFAQLASMNVDLGLDGRLRIQQEDAQLSMLGELRTLRGEAVAMGKRFVITEGTVTFTGENYTNPQLDLGAAHQVGRYGSVEIKIAGDAENTSIHMSSPEYPDQTDVMSMLLFGKPTSAMSETEGESGAGLLSAAMASVGGQAARSTGAAFLQNVQIDPGSGSVKVGFPLTDKVYLSIERVRPEADTDNMTQAAIEWLLSRAAYGEVVTGDRGKTSGDVYLRWRF